MPYDSLQNLVLLPRDRRDCKNLVGGSWVPSVGRETLAVESPYTGESIGTVARSREADVAAVVAAAKSAAPAWAALPLKDRTRPLFRFRDLLLSHLDELANTVAVESGKTREEGRGGVLRGIEVVEFALSLQNRDLGGAIEVSRGVSCEFRREALGVVAGVTPFNFPAMVPLWMFPIAVTLGNAFILKPSEKVPLTASRLGELMLEAGYPAGIFSIVHGDREAALCLADHPDVQALGFVGSSTAARGLFARASAQGKRALCLGGAKNHLIVAPDADEALAIKAVVDSFTGCAGQRCMAASVMVAVAEADRLVAKVAETAAAIVLGSGMGALIDAAARARLWAAIAKAEGEGAKLLLDGRPAKPPTGGEGGFWLGPTILDHARPGMECAEIELFGPLLTVIRVKTLDEALALEKSSRYGNATSIFTTRGAVARYVSERATSGMIGVNVGVPVPRDPFSFGGAKDSKFGHGEMTGPGAVEFWSNLKKITTKWASQSDANWCS